MNWFNLLYERNSGRADEPDKPRPEGFRLFVHTFLRNWWGLIGLNILFFFSCLFLITIPAALAAVTRICICMLRGEAVAVPEEYWKTFRECFLRSLAAGGILAVLLALTGYGAVIYGKAMAENGLLAAPFVILLLVFLLLLMSSFTLFQMVVFSELKISRILKNAVFLTLICPGRHLLVLAVLAGLIVLYTLCFPYSTVALATIVLSSFWLFACNVLWPVTRSRVFLEE